MMEQFQQKCDAYNASCAQQLKEMNENKTLNIIQRKGIEGWHTAENVAFLEKSFEFATHEQATEFCMRVGKEATKKDHHPEWSLNGTTVNVKLTSHFANNTATVYDFELAEQMNKAYKSTKQNHTQYPWVNQKQISSVLLGTLIVVGGYAYLKFALDAIHPVSFKGLQKYIDNDVPLPSVSKLDYSEAVEKRNIEILTLQRFK